MNFDEYTVGNIYETKSYKITKEDIIRFANEFDPQYMHIDENEAKQSRFGGIIASGVHTLAISIKLWANEGIFDTNVIAGTGIDNIKFIKPVYPEDELHLNVEIIDKKLAKNETGYVTIKIFTYNHHKELVFEGEVTVLVKR